MQVLQNHFIRMIIICAILLPLMATVSCSTKGKKIFMIDSSRGDRFDEMKLEKVNDQLFIEGSFLRITSFDGKETKTYTVKALEQIKKIKGRLDRMKFKKAEALPENAIKPPFYGMQSLTKKKQNAGTGSRIMSG